MSVEQGRLIACDISEWRAAANPRAFLLSVMFDFYYFFLFLFVYFDDIIVFFFVSTLRMIFCIL